LIEWINFPNLIEFNVVEPKWICLEIDEIGYIKKEAPKLTFHYWQKLLFALANFHGIYFDMNKQPRLSVVLPGGHRMEAMLGTCVDKKISVSVRIRRNIRKRLTDFGITQELEHWLINMVKQGCNFIISGWTGSGKTTFLNTLISHIPRSSRILTVEDTREIFLESDDYSCQYIVSRNEKSTNIGYNEIIDHIVRSRPDILVVGEVSIGNAYPILRLLNSGHKGFLCTIHANSCRSAINWAFPQNIQLAGISPDNITNWLNNALDVVIQLGANIQTKFIKEIYSPKTDFMIYDGSSFRL
jgi:type IV secretory pathway ATPase VirB11/archaellum biosynthesis ATPase